MTADGETNTARAFLDALRRSDLSALLLQARVEIGVTSDDWGGWQTLVVVHVPQPFAEALGKLPQHDRKRIAEAAISRRDRFEGRLPDDIIVKSEGEPVNGASTILPDLIIHREMMIAVGTGRQQIQEVDDYYVARQARLVDACAGAGIKYENPHASLWDWYHFWKSQNWSSYAERRDYIRKVFSGPVAAAVTQALSPGPVSAREPTGWELVDRQLIKARMQFERASAEEDWQGVGLTCREALISLGQAAHNPSVHPLDDEKGTRISRTDARRLLDAWLHHEMPGGNNKEVRAHIKGSLDLAVHLQHRRTATRQLAALCLEATASAIAVVAIIAGRN